MIRVWIVDDQEIVREGLKMLLSLHEDMVLVGEAGNGEELLERLEELAETEALSGLPEQAGAASSLAPDVLLMDVRMPVMDGIEATRQVKQLYPGIKILILTTFDEEAYLFGGLRNGADGYMLKESGSGEIAAAIRTVFGGGMLLDAKARPSIIRALDGLPREPLEEQSRDPLALLTPRERDTVRLLLDGKSNREIGEAMYVTEGTVKNYVSRILEKLELKSRAELIVYLGGSHSR
jgi:DNA-binding NarL/FixJ family response regulator